MRISRFRALFPSVLGAALLGLAIVALIPGMGKADNPPQVLYHSLSDTFGCGDPAAALALTDPSEPRRRSPAWVKSTFSEGHCVAITPKSPWRLVSRAGDTALMEYAGTVGPPGSYYLRLSDMVDPNGAHPGDASPPPGAAQAAPAPATDTSSPTALAPTSGPEPSPQSAMQPVVNPAASSSGATWTTTDVALLVLAIGFAFAAGFVLGRKRI